MSTNNNSVDTKVSSEASQPSEKPRAIGWLRVIAWVYLAISVSGSIALLVTYPRIVTPVPNSRSRVNETLDPIAVGYSIGLTLQGILICTFLLVIASIAVNLFIIRKNTTPK